MKLWEKSVEVAATVAWPPLPPDMGQSNYAGGLEGTSHPFPAPGPRGWFLQEGSEAAVWGPGAAGGSGGGKAAAGDLGLGGGPPEQGKPPGHCKVTGGVTAAPIHPAHPTCPPSHLPTCPLAHLPTFPPATCQPAHLPTCLPRHLPTCPPKGSLRQFFLV